MKIQLTRGIEALFHSCNEKRNNKLTEVEFSELKWEWKCLSSFIFFFFFFFFTGLLHRDIEISFSDVNYEMNINRELSYSRNKKLIKVNQFLLSEFKFLEILISYNIFPSEKKRKMAVKL